MISLPWPVLAAASLPILSPTLQALVFAAGAISMLLGVYLRWRLPHERMAAEEYTKDRKLTEDQARQRVQLLRFGGPFAVFVGLVLFALVLLQ